MSVLEGVFGAQDQRNLIGPNRMPPMLFYGFVQLGPGSDVTLAQGFDYPPHFDPPFYPPRCSLPRMRGGMLDKSAEGASRPAVALPIERSPCDRLVVASAT